MQDLKIIVSGGGTGGHIFPAIAIANSLKEKFPNAKFLFVGAKGRMEMEKVPAAGYAIEGLWISGLQRKLSFKNLSIPFKLISSTIKAKKIIKSFKPDIVIGTGGYASAPVLRVAAKKGILTLIQEQNSYPGITNKILSKSVDKICVAYDNMDRFFPKEKIYLTGNPIRNQVVQIEGKKEKAHSFFGLEAGKKTLLIIGGSLGARTINEAIQHVLNDLSANNIQMVWQTGKNYLPIAKKAIIDAGVSGVFAYDFIYEMDMAYAAADVVISRAGAIAISELCAVKKPVILIPSPFVAEDHQTKNALALVNYSAAIMVKDVEVKEKIGPAVIDLMNDESKQLSLSQNIAALAKVDAAEKISDIIIGML